MKRINLLITASLLSISATGLDAKTLRQADGPANLPPETYAGLQFIDNRGCVYIRSGYGGRVTWVPRVDRKRRHICDKKLKPTFGKVAQETGQPDESAKKTGIIATLAAKRDQGGKPELDTPVVKETVAAEVTAPAPTLADEMPAAEAKPEVNVPEQTPELSRAEKRAQERAEKQRLRKEAAAQRAQERAEKDRLRKEAAILRAQERAQKREALASELAAKKQAKEEARAAKAEAAESARAEKAAALEQARAERARAKEAKKQETAAKKSAAKQVVKETVVEAPKAVAKTSPAAVIKRPSISKKRRSQNLKPGVYVNVGQFDQADDALKISTWFNDTGHRSKVITDGDTAVVYVGPFRSAGAAKAALYQATGAGYNDAKIINR